MVLTGLDLTIGESALLICAIILSGVCCSYVFLQCCRCAEGRAEKRYYIRDVLNEDLFETHEKEAELLKVSVTTPGNYQHPKNSSISVYSLSPENQYPKLLEDQEMEPVFEEDGYLSPKNGNHRYQHHRRKVKRIPSRDYDVGVLKKVETPPIKLTDIIQSDEEEFVRL